MNDAYFGTKELYEVVLKANLPMSFGSRQIEVGEPVLYFEKVNIAQLNEQTRPVLARGGWGNMPHVIWEDRSEVTFSLSEGVMSSIGMSVLMSAATRDNPMDGTLYLQKKEGPFSTYNGKYTLERTPALNKKMFCFEYDREVIQKKVDFTIDGKTLSITQADDSKEYLLDYYFQYGKEALIYLVEKERFNGTFSLEGKFYTKDENDGLNSTNILFMPKIRVVSDINLRLGERADPTVSVFNIIAMPARVEENDSLLMKIIHLNEDIDADI